MIDDTAGIAFPFQSDPSTGSVGWASGMDKIRQNGRVILGTQVGDRPMLLDFGTRIASLVHEPNDDVIGDLIQNQARQSLLQWEPRILLTQLRIEQTEGELRLRLGYVRTNEPVADQMVMTLT